MDREILLRNVARLSCSKTCQLMWTEILFSTKKESLHQTVLAAKVRTECNTPEASSEEWERLLIPIYRTE